MSLFIACCQKTYQAVGSNVAMLNNSTLDFEQMENHSEDELIRMPLFAIFYCLSG